LRYRGKGIAIKEIDFSREWRDRGEEELDDGEGKGGVTNS